VTSPTRGEGAQLRALTRAFLFRFFENEITAGSNDLRGSFLWLLSVIVPPGLCIPFIALTKWTTMNYVLGAEGVRRLAWMDKTVYLGLGMIVAGAAATIVWSSLLVDRRDTLVLGAQPLRGRTIVAAKLVALGAYAGMLIVGMHALASFSYGVLLGNFGDVSFALRGIVAHFVASSLGSAFVFLAVCGLQGLLLATFGPRLFARISPIVQLLLAVLVLESLIALPLIGGSAVRSLEDAGVPPLVVHLHGRTRTAHPTSGPEAIARPWTLRTPPIWFLGVYEEVSGTTEPRLRELAGTGLLALAGALGLVLVTYPLAYRRMAVAAVENVDDGTARRARLSRFLPQLLARDPTTRAAAQFLLATLGRVERHRFVVAMAVGIALAFAVPLAIGSAGLLDQPLSWRSVPLLAIPYYVMACLAAGLRFAAVLPGDLRAAWIFDVTGPDRWRARAALWRVMFLVAVVAPQLAFLPIAWHAWGAWFAVSNLAAGLAMGALLIEALLWRTLAVPCAEAWRPRTGHLRTWWPAYFFAFLLFTNVAPALGMLAVQRPLALFVVLGVIVLGTMSLHFARRSTVVVDDNEDDAPRLDVLNLQ
jgi:hypothetical protein